MENRQFHLYYRTMEGFRAVYDEAPGEMAVQVLGFHHDIGHVTGSRRGPEEWFCFVFHDPVPVLTAIGERRAAADGVMIHAPGEPVLQGIDGPWRRSWIRFRHDRGDLLLTRCGLESRRLYDIDAPGMHDRWLLAMREELEHPSGADPRNLHDLLACWWRSIARAVGDHHRRPEPAVIARRLIEARYREDLSLDGLAAAAGCSRTHLCRGFRAAFATTPMRYAQRLRLQHAADLLHNSDLPVAAIAEQSGFSDIYYFSRAFKKEHGLTPTRFRCGT